MPLQLEYRPDSLETFFGNQTTVKKLTALLKRGPKGFPKTIILQGASGCGKTTLARIIASYFKVNKLDFKQLNISDARGIDNARVLIGTLQYSPIGDMRVIVLNECHQATKDFQNAMLEVLEEPPPGTIFILCTTEPEKLLKTIRDNQRGVTLDVEPLNLIDSKALIKYVLEEEFENGLESFPKLVIDKIIKIAEGHPRKIMAILDSILDMYKEDEQTLLDAISGNTGAEDAEVIELCRLLLKKGIKWAVVAKALKALKVEPEAIRNIVVGYMNSVLLSGKENDTAAMCIEALESVPFPAKAGYITKAFYEVLK